MYKHSEEEMKKLAAILVIMVLGTLLLPSGSLAQETVECEVEYTVQKRVTQLITSRWL